MYKRLNPLVSLSLIAIFLLVQCSPVTAVPTVKETESPEPQSILQVDVQPVGPYLVGQTPPEGQRLELNPTLEFTFDRDMDPDKTADAFSLLDSDNEPVPGKFAWLSPKTFSFKPNSKLEPSSIYKAIFSTSATASDGETLREEIRLELATIDALAVSQVFPVDRTEEIDPKTNITVIFNHPVVPLQIREEQKDLPQPLTFSPEVTGTGEWINSSVYVFQPEKPLLSGTNYKVKVEAGLKDTNGELLKRSFSWTFSTRAPLIGNFMLKNGYSNPPENIQDVLLDQAFIVTFLQPMDEKSVRESITLVNRETGKPFPTKLTWDKTFTTLTIEPVGRYKIASFYDLNILDTARASDGGKLKQGLHLKFGTVPLPAIKSIFPKPNSEAKDFDSHIEIAFASPMKLDSLKNKIKISPQPRDELQWYFNDYDWTLRVYGLEPATEYVVRILPGMSDIYGNTIQTEQSFTFKTGNLHPYARLVLPWTPLVYRAKGPQEVYFENLNLDEVSVMLYALDYSQFSLMLSGKVDPVNFNPKVEPLREWKPSVDAPRNQMNYEKFKLGDVLENPLKPGYYFIGVKGKPLDYTSNFYQGFLFIVATDNITLKTTDSEASAWVTDLEAGRPQPNVSVTFYDNNWTKLGTVTTDRDGIAYKKDIKNPTYARLEGADHNAFTSIEWGSGVWAGNFGLYENFYYNPNPLFGYVYTDRPVYRPGQDVFFKGIVRDNDDLHYSLPRVEKVYVSIEQAGEKVFGEYIPLSELGSFDGKLTLSDDAALGTYDMYVWTSPVAESTFAYLSFRVAEYHKPEFEVNASSDKGNLLAGEEATFSLDAKYYAGGNLGNADTEWFLQASPYYFQPSSDYWEFNFMDWDRDEFWSPQKASGTETLANGKGVTDGAGHFEITQTLGLDKNKLSQNISFSANVTDISGNIVSGGTSVTVHQSEFYAGIRSVSYVGKQGEEQPFEVVVLDWNSVPVADQPVSVKFMERRWFSVQTQDKQGQLRWETSVKEIPISTANAVTGEDGKATVSFIPPQGGVYKAIVTVRDTKGHTHQASAYMWVASDDYVAWRQTNDRTFNLIVDKDSYSPGDTAEILIAQPFDHDVYALVTYERGHVYKQDVILLKGNSTTYQLPITSEMAPISYVSVTVISGAYKDESPDFKIGMASINVDTSEQTLDVTVTADTKSAGPGDEVTYTIETKDYNGRPVSADVSLAVVDKAALALAPMNSAPMLDAFYPQQALSVRTALGLVSNAEDFNAQYGETIPDGGRGGGGGGGPSLGIISTRKDFKDTAWFEANVVTDKDGKAQVKVTLPENLTTWKADVRAITVDSRVGQTTSDLLSTKPLFVEMQTPRFFVNGDTATVGATVHNNTDKDMKVNVSLDADGVELLSSAAQETEVLAGQQTYVKWDVAVQGGAKRVDFTVQAVSGDYVDSSKPALGTLSDQGIPVYNYTAVETVGTSGMIQNANSSTEAIQLPQSLNFADASLSIEVSPSLAASMQSGLTYLEDYPYLCMEQTVSRFLPNVITSRALKNAGIDNGHLQNELDAQVNAALQRIYAKQHYDGGWNWWDGEKSDPQTSAYVVYGLIEAKESGYTVSESVLARGIKFLEENVPMLKRNDATWQYNRTAFMLYVLARANELRPSQVNFIYEHKQSLSLYGKAYLAQAMYMLDKDDERTLSLLSDLESAAVLSAAGAHWEESTKDYWNWNTDTRTTAIVLNAFVQMDATNPVTAQAVRWLMAHRDSGHWHTTQETAWSLIALTNWMTISNEYDTNYNFAVGLNGEMLNQGNATKENLTETVNLQVEMKDLLKEAANYLVFTRGDGTGNLYYTAYLSAELPVESIQPLDQGVSLSRQYFSVDDNKNPITEIQRGELVRVRLTVVVPAAVHYIVVDDPLPAGFEAIDATLQTDTAVPTSYTVTDYNERGWGWWYFSHIELRDEKVVLSADYLPAGTYVYTYLARASTAGTFKVIPPTASEFYFPDVGGRGAGSVFEVKE
ncbi:MAG: Ig-like domain-containing protein [Chloroflexi bacterium]|nr:Ig-like domain-containing protein [Chloroflexota bacterium]